MVKLSINNSIFQAELLAISEAFDFPFLVLLTQGKSGLTVSLAYSLFLIHLQLVELQELSKKSCLLINTYLLDGSERIGPYWQPYSEDNLARRAVTEGISTPVPLPLCYARNIVLQALLYQ
ncbi:hypothetical protein AVEN_212945-1 [Araneus ventricosus]|uniref:Uncharacterized protein n=1 Tax=Araneus ventricosus TaxID=182803 RepID=A0A4Y2UFN7_ARAVE|nr:hypothetical protein AVEN_212945-1 [Araneus ventricosus]